MELEEETRLYNLTELEICGDVSRINEIVCPYCGYELYVDYAGIEDDTYQGYEYQCLHCDKMFLIDWEPAMSFRFTSRKYKED